MIRPKRDRKGPAWLSRTDCIQGVEAVVDVGECGADVPSEMDGLRFRSSPLEFSSPKSRIIPVGCCGDDGDDDKALVDVECSAYGAPEVATCCRTRSK